MTKLEFVIPKAIAIKKVSNLEIPIYGFVFQREEEAREDAVAEYLLSSENKTKAKAPQTTLNNRIAAAFLASRVSPEWNLEEVTARIPFTFAEQIYEIFMQERSYDAEKKEREEAKKLKALEAKIREEIMKEVANTSEDLSLPTGEKSDTD